MYVCSGEECNTMREPVCLRGRPVTAFSVTGTGPGAACKPPKPPAPPPAPKPRLGCRINVIGQGAKRIRVNSSGPNLTVC